MSTSRLLAKFLRDWFLLGMVLAVFLATLIPEVGRSGGAIRADILSDVGIFAIFFLHGVNLSSDSLKLGLLRWPLHVLVQTFTFVVFPLLWLMFYSLFAHLVPFYLMLGFLYLCALPSTISSSVAMTAIARGNVAGAIFNATLSSLLGIFITPFLISLATRSNAQALPLSQAILKLATLLLLPLLAGQLIRPFAGYWFGKYRRYTTVFDKSVILLLVFSSFSDSVVAGLWTNYGVATIGLTVAVSALLLLIVMVLTTWTARLLHFSKEDEIAAVFCGSKKTLASGVPMARLIFGAHPALGIIVLPIMFYHQIQLFVCSMMADRYAQRVELTQALPVRPSLMERS
jgi:solute carrier family 10 (sodium/bile acid cotransporter), member 7